MATPVALRPLDRTLALSAIVAVAVGGLGAILWLTASGMLAVWGIAGLGMVALLAAARPGTAQFRVGAVLVGAVTLLGTEPGLQTHEILYGLVMVSYLGGWYLSRWLGSQRLVVSGTDLAIALWLSVGVAGAAVLGLMFGPDTPTYLGELVAIVPMYFYFPAKEACAKSKEGLAVIAGAFVLLGLYATVSGAFWLRSTIDAAETLYQIADARFTAGESYMALGFLIAIALSGASERWSARGAWLAAASILLGGFILTRTRSFWVSTAVGLVVMLGVATREDRRRTVLFLAAGTAALGLIAAVQFREQMMLLVAGTVGRLSSLGTAATSDASLLARFAEYEALIGRLKTNPVLGYGWGVVYSHYSALSSGTRTWAFTHNGWLYVWYKTGLWGLALMGYAWVSAGWAALLTARSRWMPRSQRALGAALAGGIVTYAIASNAANPYFGQDTVLSVALLLAMASGLGQRRQALGERTAREVQESAL